MTRIVTAGLDGSPGSRTRHSLLGAHIGAFTHAVTHHGTAPVAVVAHG